MLYNKTIRNEERKKQKKNEPEIKYQINDWFNQTVCYNIDIKNRATAQKKK